jgi:hypothetical protein
MIPLMLATSLFSLRADNKKINRIEIPALLIKTIKRMDLKSKNGYQTEQSKAMLHQLKTGIKVLRKSKTRT